MNKQKILEKLEELYGLKEVTEGFSSQAACIEWSNKVAPLLKFNEQYYVNFMQNAHKINLPLSSYTLGPALNIMKSQVKMAIEELKLDSEKTDNEFSEIDTGGIWEEGKIRVLSLTRMKRKSKPRN